MTPFTVPDKQELTDGLVRLRPHVEEDVEPVYVALRESVAEVSRWMPWCHADYSRQDARTWFEGRDPAWRRGAEFDFVILDAAGQVAGCCGLNHIVQIDRRANLGYWVRTSCAGRGLATAATRLVARWGFEQLGLMRIEIVAAVGNLASQRVAEKAGATREGVQRNRCFLHGRPQDAYVFSLVPGEV